jgi:hypothetical protein
MLPAAAVWRWAAITSYGFSTGYQRPVRLASRSGRPITRTAVRANARTRARRAFHRYTGSALGNQRGARAHSPAASSPVAPPPARAVRHARIRHQCSRTSASTIAEPARPLDGQVCKSPQCRRRTGSFPPVSSFESAWKDDARAAALSTSFAGSDVRASICLISYGCARPEGSRRGGR